MLKSRYWRSGSARPADPVRIIKIHDRTVPISRYSDPATPAGNLTTTALALLTDFRMNGDPVVGFGFTSIGRFGQSGLIQERFAPRLLAATENELAGADGPIDPERAWKCLMRDEKPGGHGERCVAVGALDMALWDIAAKIAGKPLYRYLRDRLGRTATGNRVAVYAGGGYYFESHDSERLKEEVRRFLDLGYTKIKIKIGGRPLAKDIARIEAALSLLPNGGCLAVDAMNRYTERDALETAKTLEPYSLRWFEDICDPQDFETNRRIAEAYRGALAAGEAIFSLADARNLLRYAGLRTNHDVLVFDPAHCYGLPEFLRIIEAFEAAGWSRTAFQPHGGHLFSLQVAAGLDLGGSEANPHNFQPFGGFSDDALVQEGVIELPEAPGIGFETRASLRELFQSVALGA
jgi:L-alanine-DL-glutamate epimerase-like enolase superfamily enzyme